MIKGSLDASSPCGRKRRKKHCRTEAGFTLVEILVVLAIIGLIMGLVGPRVMSYLSDAKAKTAKIQIETLTAALDLFMMDAGRYPTAQEGLAALVEKPADAPAWRGPYLRGAAVPMDPWGRPYVYRVPGKSAPFEIVTAGPENKQAVPTAALRK